MHAVEVYGPPSMFKFFRNFFKTKIGLAVTFAFLGLIAFAFASADVTNTGLFGGIAGGERVAVVGEERIDSSDLVQTANQQLEVARRSDPTISMPAFVEQGGLTRLLDQLVDRSAIAGFARRYGLTAGDNLVNSEIRQIPAFRGPDGNFSSQVYNQALAQQGLSDGIVRRDLANGLLAQQMLTPAQFGASMPRALAYRYARLFRERRKGTIAFLPSLAFAPEGDPTEAQLQAFYSENRSQFIRPERRTIRYAAFDDSAVSDRIEPTDAEIAQRYAQNRSQYAASETRSFTQLIVPTEQAARALRSQIQSGAAFEQVARNAGFRPSELTSLTRQQLAADTSAAVATAYFAAPRGSVTEPSRSPLGFHIARVDAVDSQAARTLAQARTEIADALREEKRRQALANFAAEIEEAIDDGETLAGVARARGLEVQTSPPLTADGTVYGEDGETVPETLAPALATAFQMDESEPQVAEVERGEQYIVFEVSRIRGSAAAPLAEIRDQVEARYRLSRGSQAARSAADRIIKRLAGGSTMRAALSAEKASLPAIETVDLSREDLNRQGDRGIPPPLALMFSMAQGTTKRLETANDLGWFVVDLDTIELGELDRDDPIVAQGQDQLATVAGEEYVEQLVRAMREQLGVEVNQTALDAVRRQLVGEQ